MRIRLFCILMVATLMTGGSAEASYKGNLEVTKAAFITNTDSTDTRSLVKFELDSTVLGMDINYAVIEVQFATPTDSAEHFVVTLFPMKEAWSENVKWSSGLTKAGGDFHDDVGIAIPVSAKKGYKARVNISEILQLWADSKITNNGFILVSAQKTRGTGKLQLSDGKPDNAVSGVEVRFGPK
ncbi:MAG: DNRLRE domain-containing protein [candidate division Zixibacteria bacterium]|nr:DNRLRE domain-containing protein [candidate division Zixibacteria bacterium]MDH3938371.1 DNRLRE domain-containing protein [candidate division Zixibacteria bacterium]MDH4033514.1 DNRLRE domain-containing protein [candidate division Zixibacteria bacterium]